MSSSTTESVFPSRWFAGPASQQKLFSQAVSLLDASQRSSQRSILWAGNASIFFIGALFASGPSPFLSLASLGAGFSAAATAHALLQRSALRSEARSFLAGVTTSAAIVSSGLSAWLQRYDGKELPLSEVKALISTSKAALEALGEIERLQAAPAPTRKPRP